MVSVLILGIVAAVRCSLMYSLLCCPVCCVLCCCVACTGLLVAIHHLTQLRTLTTLHCNISGDMDARKLSIIGFSRCRTERSISTGGKIPTSPRTQRSDSTGGKLLSSLRTERSVSTGGKIPVSPRTQRSDSAGGKVLSSLRSERSISTGGKIPTSPRTERLDSTGGKIPASPRTAALKYPGGCSSVPGRHPVSVSPSPSRTLSDHFFFLLGFFPAPGSSYFLTFSVDASDSLSMEQNHWMHLDTRDPTCTVVLPQGVVAYSGTTAGSLIRWNIRSVQTLQTLWSEKSSRTLWNFITWWNFTSFQNELLILGYNLQAMQKSQV